MERIIKRQQKIQMALRRRRQFFAESCRNGLSKSYIFHEFKQESYKNRYEIQRTWNKATDRLLKEVSQMIETDPTLGSLPLQIIANEASFVLHLSGDFKIDRNRIEQLISEMRKLLRQATEGELGAEAVRAANAFESDVEYWRLLQEIEAEAEHIAWKVKKQGE